ncbi:MAG: RIP metalloprotease RseP [Phycisphaerales bacterium]|nr:RIP metalloprotease RseP [Phycisphaerales bacterium]
MQLNTILLMAEWQVKGLQVFVALSLLIILHEFGHFFFAKLFKTRVEKFYLFFDFLFPFGNVLPFSLFKKTKGDTTYGIGWFPLGGYVKIAGMVDESMDKEQLALPPQPWEYRSKKPWQRLFIMLGGIIVNVLVAVLIYSSMFAYWGESYLPAQNVKLGISADSTAQMLGFKNGDLVKSVDGKTDLSLEEINQLILLDETKSVTVSRDGQDVVIPTGTIASGKMIQNKKPQILMAQYPFVILEVNPKSLADKMGLKSGDSIIAVNHVPAPYFSDFKMLLDNAKVGTPFQLTVIGKDHTLRELKSVIPSARKIGIGLKNAADYFETKKIKYGFFASIGRGVSYTGERFSLYVSNFKLLFTSKDVKLNENLGGIASFAKIFPGKFDWQGFWMLTAFISVILAFMNLLPIPGLDGGYVVFLLWEIITGRKVNDKVMEVATTIGLVLLLAFMLYANGLDVLRALK